LDKSRTNKETGWLCRIGINQYVALTDFADMNHTKTDPQNTYFAPVKKLLIQIIGRHNVHNELLADYFARHTGAACHIADSPDSAFAADAPKSNGAFRLILFDFSADDSLNILECLASLQGQEQTDRYLALYNLDRDTGIEKTCLKSGVHGFFYRDETLNMILVGIRTICSGRIWIDSDVLTKCIRNNTGWADLPTPKNLRLTSRQIEILATMATGASNKEIAERLSISPHTIKSHLYCIYQTIHVSNRLQAAAWATKHLPHVLRQKY
jgi:LuxR family transcriptional regulator of csgAB operon